MPATEPRFFLCTGECVPYQDLHKFPDSHIIGHLRYIEDEGKPVTALARWDISVSAVTVPPLHPTIDVNLIGDARQIACRFPGGCANKQNWEIGKAAFLQLMLKYPHWQEIRRNNG